MIQGLHPKLYLELIRVFRRPTKFGIWKIIVNVVNLLLSITFACGVFIAISHVANRSFIAPVYDVIANLTAFASATAASSLLGRWIPSTLSIVAFICWLMLARRTYLGRPR